MLQRITILQEEFIHFQLLEQLLPVGKMTQGLQCHLPWLTLRDSPPSIISATFSSPEPKNLSKQNVWWNSCLSQEHLLYF